MSDISITDSDDEHKIEDIVSSEPMYYVMAQFLETTDNKNVATILQELTNELKSIKTLLTTLVQQKQESS